MISDIIFYSFIIYYSIIICLARDEITRAIKDVAKGVEYGNLEDKDIDENLLSRCLDANDFTEPDFIIRTSGEHRLSDFLMWQVCILFLLQTLANVIAFFHFFRVLAQIYTLLVLYGPNLNCGTS